MTLAKIVVLLLLFLVVFATGTQGRPPVRVKKQATNEPIQSVHKRCLVVERPTWKSIVVENGRVSSNQSHSNSIGMVLGYVTPWNAGGYGYARDFWRKFHLVAPVWFAVRTAIDGEHNVDVKWMESIRGVGGEENRPKIVPRFMFELSERDLEKHLSAAVADSMASIMVRYDLDGVVLDGISSAARTAPGTFVRFLKLLRGAISLSRVLVLVIPASPAVFGPLDLQRCSGLVDYFSLNTYDHGMVNPGPIAPISWMKHVVRHLVGDAPDSSSLAKKMLLGINFYGYDWVIGGGARPEPVTGGTFIEMLQVHRPKIRWEQEASEHVGEFRAKGSLHRVYYPTLLSLNMRLKLAVTLGVGGIAIWELGQGLPYFVDLL